MCRIYTQALRNNTQGKSQESSIQITANPSVPEYYAVYAADNKIREKLTDNDKKLILCFVDSLDHANKANSYNCNKIKALFAYLSDRPIKKKHVKAIRDIKRI